MDVYCRLKKKGNGKEANYSIHDCSDTRVGKRQLGPCIMPCVPSGSILTIIVGVLMKIDHFISIRYQCLFYFDRSVTLDNI